MKSWGKLFSSAVAASLVSFIPLAVNAQIITNVFETWEGAARLDPFAGAGNVIWNGDLSSYELTTATWPSGTTSDFAGTNSLRSKTSASEVTNTVTTAFLFDPSRPTFWSVYVGGNDAAITANKAADIILTADSSDASSIENGLVNGYRLRLFGNTTNTIDNLILQRATGAGWVTLNQLSVGAGANINQGWNLLVHRESDGTWRYGYSNGTIGSVVAIGSAVNDATVLSGSQAGSTLR